METKRKIFGIGMSRTGTTSLFILLESLGFRGRHFIEELVRNADYNIPDEMELLIDSPVPLLYKNLDKKYPGSKFILTIRNKKSWLESMKWMFNHGKVIWNWPTFTHNYHKKFYHTTRFNRFILSKHYDNFHKEVQDYFKDRPKDLLVIDIDKPINISVICTFLDVPFKEIPFPKTNERRYATFKQRMRYNFHYLIYGKNLPNP